MKFMKIIVAVALLAALTASTALAGRLVRFTGNAKCYKRNGSSAGYVVKKGSVAEVVDSDDGYTAIRLNGKTRVWVMDKYVTTAKKGARVNVKYAAR